MGTSLPICAYSKCRKKVHPEDLQHSVGKKVFHDDARVLETNCWENACRDATSELGLQLVSSGIQSQFFA